MLRHLTSGVKKQTKLEGTREKGSGLEGREGTCEATLEEKIGVFGSSVERNITVRRGEREGRAVG